jgi:hypothetical protein
MQKHILKGLTMLVLIAAIALMAALVSANAQSAGSLVADIPFDFAVGGKSLKAGEYSIRAFTSNSDALVISNQNSNQAAVRLSQSIEARTAPQHAKLVFHRYGQRYFLSEVWTKGERMGRQLRKSSEERTIEGQLAAISSKSELARSSYETVEILAMVR